MEFLKSFNSARHVFRPGKAQLIIVAFHVFFKDIQVAYTGSIPQAWQYLSMLDLNAIYRELDKLSKEVIRLKYFFLKKILHI